MKATTLPFPGKTGVANALRDIAARAMTDAETARRVTGDVALATALETFFGTLKDVCTALKDETIPTLVSRTGVVAASVTTITLTFSEALRTDSTPDAAAFTIQGTPAVTSVTVVGSTVVIVVAVALVNTNTIGYTAPTVGGIRNIAGLAAATFAPAGITI